MIEERREISQNEKKAGISRIIILFKHIRVYQEINRLCVFLISSAILMQGQEKKTVKR